MIERAAAKSIGRKAFLEVRRHLGARLGSVATVFANTIYVKTDRDELVVVTRKNARSPISLNILGGSSFLSTARASADAAVEGGELVLDRLRILYDRCPEYMSHVDELVLNPSNVEIDASIVAAARILTVLAQPGCVLDPASPSHDGAGRFLTRVASVGRSIDRGRVLKGAEAILGLGFGFTPSGDDFVAGMLASFNVLSCRANRKPLVIGWETLRSRTSWISARLVDHMQNRLIDETVERCIFSIAAGEKDAAVDAVMELASRGHTSGLDVSVGLLCGASLFLEGPREERVLRNLVEVLDFRT